MRALVLHETGGPQALRLEDVPEPAAGDGLALIEVHAAGAGFVDWLITRGEYQVKPELPFIPGTEIAGVVLDAPEGSGLREGQRVAATTPFGGFAEVAPAPAFITFGIPDDLPFDIAAGMVINYQTAHLGLVRRGRIQPGEAVLVHGAAGGVGTASIQVAKAAGAGLVIAVASDDERRRVATEAGADIALDPADDWVAEVRAATGGRGADLVVDPVGGERFDQSLRCTAPEGRILVIGFASGTIPTLAVNRLLLRSIDVVGVNYGGMLPIDQEFAAAAHGELMTWWAEGRLRPIIGDRAPLADGAALLAGFAEGGAVGKPVILVR